MPDNVLFHANMLLALFYANQQIIVVKAKLLFEKLYSCNEILGKIREKGASGVGGVESGING